MFNILYSKAYRIFKSLVYSRNVLWYILDEYILEIFLKYILEIFLRYILEIFNLKTCINMCVHLDYNQGEQHKLRSQTDAFSTPLLLFLVGKCFSYIEAQINYYTCTHDA